MAKDPVCGEEVTADSAYFSNYSGDTYYFTSQECKVEFDQSPEHFVSRMQSDGDALTPATYPTIGTAPDSVDSDGAH